jgi:hypothetical protein
MIQIFVRRRRTEIENKCDLIKSSVWWMFSLEHIL